MAQYALRADDDLMARWKDEAKSRGLSFSVFCREALDAYCEDFGAIADRVVGKAEPPPVIEEVVSAGVPDHPEPSSDLFEPLTPLPLLEECEAPAEPQLKVAWLDPDPVRDDTVARIFGRLESGEAPSRPGKSRSVPCEHRVPAGTFCKFGCDG